MFFQALLDAVKAPTSTSGDSEPESSGSCEEVELPQKNVTVFDVSSTDTGSGDESIDLDKLTKDFFDTTPKPRKPMRPEPTPPKSTPPKPTTPSNTDIGPLSYADIEDLLKGDNVIAPAPKNYRDVFKRPAARMQPTVLKRPAADMEDTYDEPTEGGTWLIFLIWLRYTLYVALGKGEEIRVRECGGFVL